MLPTITAIGNLKRLNTVVTQSGKAVTKFTLECSEKNSKGEWENLYLDGEVWEKQSKFLNDYFQDGSVAIVTGKLHTHVYEKQDGSKVYQNKLLFPSISFAPKDKTDNQQQNQGQQYQQQQVPVQYETVQQPQPIEVDDQTIPF